MYHQSQQLVGGGTKSSQLVGGGTKSQQLVGGGTKSQQLVGGGTKSQQLVGGGTKSKPHLVAGRASKPRPVGGGGGDGNSRGDKEKPRPVGGGGGDCSSRGDKENLYSRPSGMPSASRTKRQPGGSALSSVGPAQANGSKARNGRPARATAANSAKRPALAKQRRAQDTPKTPSYAQDPPKTPSYALSYPVSPPVVPPASLLLNPLAPLPIDRKLLEEDPISSPDPSFALSGSPDSSFDPLSTTSQSIIRITPVLSAPAQPRPTGRAMDGPTWPLDGGESETPSIASSSSPAQRGDRNAQHRINHITPRTSGKGKGKRGVQSATRSSSKPSPRAAAAGKAGDKTGRPAKNSTVPAVSFGVTNADLPTFKPPTVKRVAHGDNEQALKAMNHEARRIALMNQRAAELSRRRMSPMDAKALAIKLRREKEEQAEQRRKEQRLQENNRRREEAKQVATALRVIPAREQADQRKQVENAVRLRRKQELELHKRKLLEEDEEKKRRLYRAAQRLAEQSELSALGKRKKKEQEIRRKELRDKKLELEEYSKIVQAKREKEQELQRLKQSRQEMILRQKREGLLSSLFLSSLRRQSSSMRRVRMGAEAKLGVVQGLSTDDGLGLSAPRRTGLEQNGNAPHPAATFGSSGGRIGIQGGPAAPREGKHALVVKATTTTSTKLRRLLSPRASKANSTNSTGGGAVKCITPKRPGRKASYHLTTLGRKASNSLTTLGIYERHRRKSKRVRAASSANKKEDIPAWLAPAVTTLPPKASAAGRLFSTLGRRKAKRASKQDEDKKAQQSSSPSKHRAVKEKRRKEGEPRSRFGRKLMSRTSEKKHSSSQGKLAGPRLGENLLSKQEKRLEIEGKKKVIHKKVQVLRSIRHWGDTSEDNEVNKDINNSAEDAPQADNKDMVDKKHSGVKQAWSEPVNAPNRPNELLKGQEVHDDLHDNDDEDDPLMQEVDAFADAVEEVRAHLGDAGDAGDAGGISDDNMDREDMREDMPTGAKRDQEDEEEEEEEDEEPDYPHQNDEDGVDEVGADLRSAVAPAADRPGRTANLPGAMEEVGRKDQDDEEDVDEEDEQKERAPESEPGDGDQEATAPSAADEPDQEDEPEEDEDETEINPAAAEAARLEEETHRDQVARMWEQVGADVYAGQEAAARLRGEMQTPPPDLNGGPRATSPSTFVSSPLFPSSKSFSFFRKRRKPATRPQTPQVGQTDHADGHARGGLVRSLSTPMSLATPTPASGPASPTGALSPVQPNKLAGPASPYNFMRGRGHLKKRSIFSSFNRKTRVNVPNGLPASNGSSNRADGPEASFVDA